MTNLTQFLFLRTKSVDCNSSRITVQSHLSLSVHLLLWHKMFSIKNCLAKSLFFSFFSTKLWPNVRLEICWFRCLTPLLSCAVSKCLKKVRVILRQNPIILQDFEFLHRIGLLKFQNKGFKTPKVPLVCQCFPTDMTTLRAILVNHTMSVHSNIFWFSDPKCFGFAGSLLRW